MPSGNAESSIADDNPSAANSSAVAVSLPTQDLLRGVAVETVLRRFGHILGDSSGSADTWSLSFPVAIIDEFLSHNWSTGRFHKWLTVCLHFNLWIAVVVIVAICMLCRSLQLFCVLSPLGFFIGYNVLILPGFVFIMFFMREVLCMMGHTGCTLFLDKVCINQVDPELKAQGIAALAAYLVNSKGMLIMYNKEYLCKLWTVYELATAMILNPGARLRILPMFYPKFVCIGFLIQVVVCAVWGVLLRAGRLDNSVMVVFIFVANWWLFPVYRQWGQERAAIAEVVSGFDARTAKCFDERDRLLVEGGIVRFMREKFLVEADADDDVVLTAFNDLVKQKVPELFQTYFGPAGVPYLGLVAICLPAWNNAWPTHFILTGEADVWNAISMLVEYIFRLAQYANGMAFLSWLVAWTSHRRSLVAFLIFNFCVGINVLIVGWYVFFPEHLWTKVTHVAKWITVAVHMAVTWKLWRRPLPVEWFKLQVPHGIHEVFGMEGGSSRGAAVDGQGTRNELSSDISI